MSWISRAYECQLCMDLPEYYAWFVLSVSSLLMVCSELPCMRYLDWSSFLGLPSRRPCTLAVSLHRRDSRLDPSHTRNYSWTYSLLEIFTCAHLKFMVYGRKQTDRQTDRHMRNFRKCSHASVGSGSPQLMSSYFQWWFAHFPTPVHKLWWVGTSSRLVHLQTVVIRWTPLWDWCHLPQTLSILHQVYTFHCFLVPGSYSLSCLILFLSLEGLPSLWPVSEDILMWYSCSSPVGPRWTCRTLWWDTTSTILEPLLKDTHEFRTPWLIRT